MACRRASPEPLSQPRPRPPPHLLPSPRLPPQPPSLSPSSNSIERAAASIQHAAAFPLSLRSILYALHSALMLSRLRPLFPYLRRYWRSFAWGGLALIVYNAAKAMIPLLIGGATRDIQHNLSVTTVEHHAHRILAVAVVAAITLY